MPAVRLRGTEATVRRFDVVGTDSERTPEFVRHVGLADEEREHLTFAEALPIVHMAPPLGRNPEPVHCVGQAELTVDEIRQINLLVEELESEYQAASVRNDTRRQYVVAPHVRDERAKDGTTIYRRFSCGGFVIEAYAEIDIELLRTDPDELPKVSLGTLIEQYPDLERALKDSRLRERCGLQGDGPWPVVLAGYVINALARSADEVRSSSHAAVAGDEYFPSRRADDRSA